MKKVLIISPYFAPTNSADSHRVRMSLPFFKQFGWEAEVVTVNEVYSDLPKDQLLLQSIPKDVKVHKIKAFSKKWTSKFGFGNIAFRSYYFYRKYVNQLLIANHFDLIYFSTTQFPITILGSYWEKKFRIPYVIDMQDPWHSDYYLKKPRNERPPKFKLSYALNKFLEPIALKNVSGLISVSDEYISLLKDRYNELKEIPFKIIPFGVHNLDFKIAIENKFDDFLELEHSKKNIIYTGAIGSIMKESIEFFCKSLYTLKETRRTYYDKLNFYFIGTSYTPNNLATESVIPIAEQFDVADCIKEFPNRIGYFNSINLLQRSDGLIVLGSDDNSYNPSKLFTYIYTEKQIIGIFKKQSTASSMIDNLGSGIVIYYDHPEKSLDDFLTFFERIIDVDTFPKETSEKRLESYHSEYLTKEQCLLFNAVI